jgi:hypothetical protein
MPDLLMPDFHSPFTTDYSVLKLFIPKQPGFRVAHSVRNDSTGFANAARRDL